MLDGWFWGEPRWDLYLLYTAFLTLSIVVLAFSLLAPKLQISYESKEDAMDKFHRNTTNLALIEVEEKRFDIVVNNDTDWTSRVSDLWETGENHSSSENVKLYIVRISRIAIATTVFCGLISIIRVYATIL